MKNFREYLTRWVDLSDEDWDVIYNCLEPLHLKKNQVLTKAAEVEQYVYFIEKGIIRLYCEGDEKDFTLNFGFPNQFFSSYSSFLSGKPSNFILQSLTEVQLIRLSKNNLNTIYEQTKCGQQLGRLFAEQLFLYLSKRENDFLLRTPSQRYFDLFEEQPQLIQQIPLKYLASYIGITPQALSRIRARAI